MHALVCPAAVLKRRIGSKSNEQQQQQLAGEQDEAVAAAQAGGKRPVTPDPKETVSSEGGVRGSLTSAYWCGC